MDVSLVQAYDEHKKDAYSFLKNVEKAINLQLPPPSELRTQIRKLNAECKADKTLDYLNSPEAAFLNKFVVHTLWELMSKYDGMDDAKARESLLNEYKRMREKFCSGPTIRSQRHPFTKIMASRPSTVMQQWLSGALTQSSPDICTREPFPFKILFEVKYLEKAGRERAVTELVTSIYQAFFYRGLPYVAPRKGGPAWDYEFGCMLAGDATEEGSLQKAWEAIPSPVKKGLWEGANVYVMIVRSQQ
jgi:hypothetical protein